MEKTAMCQAIKKLEEEPLEMVSQKAIAEWLKDCYVDIERQQIIDAWNSAGGGDDHHIGEDYYTQKYTQ
jgi:hypothetical protein